MQLNYVESQSTVKPLEIDVTSSNAGVYIRRNIKEIENEDGTKYFQYQEAFVSKSAYEQVSKDLLIGQFNDEDNTAEYEAYKQNLESAVPYKNGRSYKVKWVNIYADKINEIMPILSVYKELGGDVSTFETLKVNIYDVTGKPENAVAMSVKDLIELWFYLLTKQEEFFNAYKASLQG